jgi:apolipoprotein N-acyltransferase
MTSIPKYALALVAGVVLASGAPPFDLYPALWLGMVALAWLLDDDRALPSSSRSARIALTGAARGLAFGVGANVVALRFIPGVVARFTPLPWVAGALGLLLLAAFEGLRWMLAGVACETLVRARVPHPVAFAAGVYGGTFLPTMLPWTPAGGASPWPVMVQLADVVGERGVTALMALVAGLLASGLKGSLWQRCRRAGVLQLAGAVLLLGAQLGLGVVRMAAVERTLAMAPHARVALVQPSIGATIRWEEGRAPTLLAGLTALTARAESQGAELVVWPEAAFPYLLRHGSQRQLDGQRAIVQSPAIHGPVLTGLLMSGGPDGADFNSAVVATGDGALSTSYDKRHLLWFGETVPLADRVPLLRRVFARGLGLAAGDHAVALPAARVRAGVLVCYEDMLPEAGRETMEASPNLLVNVTNDAWFAGSSESELHLRVAALRAIEARRDFVRAVNLGPTSWVDAAGRVRMRASADFAGILMTTPALLDSPPTLYTRLGDVPVALSLLVLANIAVWRRVRRR